MLKRGLTLIIVCLLLINTYGQDNKSVHQKVYNLNYKLEIPLTIGLMATSFGGFIMLNEKPTLDSTQIFALNKNNVWAFDRIALEQNYSSSARKNAISASDWGIGAAILLPAFLFLDKKIRKDWFDILFLFVETQTISFNMYAYGGPLFVNRIRPFVYYSEAPMTEKMDKGASDAFFSGHTSWTATASFFMVKVYSDYHPELGAMKWLLYGAALIPPAFVGYYRYKALKHFPSDIIVGTAIGAAVGILVPHLHKINRKGNKSVSLLPYAGEYSGLALKVKF